MHPGLGPAGGGALQREPGRKASTQVVAPWRHLNWASARRSTGSGARPPARAAVQLHGLDPGSTSTFGAHRGRPPCIRSARAHARTCAALSGQLYKAAGGRQPRLPPNSAPTATACLNKPARRIQRAGQPCINSPRALGKPADTGPQGRERTNPEQAGSSYTAREYNSKRGHSIKAGPHACGLQPPSGASAPARARRSKQQQGQPTRSNSKQAGRGKQQKQQPSRQQTQGSRNSRQRARAGSCPPGRAGPVHALLWHAPTQSSAEYIVGMR